MTTCEKAGLNNCMYCREYGDTFSKPDECFIEYYKAALRGSAFIPPGEERTRFRKRLLHFIQYNKDKKDIEGNPALSYVKAAIKLYYPEYMGDYEKFLLLI